VLVGGGHAHVHVLNAFAMRPESGVRQTLITRDLETPYSGMLPGVIAGLYTAREAHIDLVKLAAATIAVKPTGKFIRKFNRLMEEAKDDAGPRRIAVIGGGAGGVELLLSVRSRILRELGTLEPGGAKFEFALVADREVLPSHASRVRTSFRDILKARDVDLHENARSCDSPRWHRPGRWPHRSCRPHSCCDAGRCARLVQGYRPDP
jgi:selenide,water dikinase